MIRETTLLSNVVFQTFDVSGPFVLGMSKLGYSKLGKATDTGSWTEWTAHATSIVAHRGARRDGVTIQNEVGLLTITMRDPGNILNVANGLFPDTPARLVLRLGGVDRPLFTGRIYDMRRDLVRLTGRRTLTPVAVITIADAVRSHNSITRYGALPTAGYETFRARILRLTETAREPIEAPSTSPTALLARTVYESSLSNHLTLACQTMGAMWYVGADGTTRTRILDPDKAPQGPPFTFGTRPGALHHIRSQPSNGLADFVNTLYARQHRAKPDPNNPSSWVADDSTELTYYDPVSQGRWGNREAVHDTNYYFRTGDDFSACQARITPARDPKARVRRITWNAQESLADIPRLELGNVISYTDLSVTRTGPDGGTYWPEQRAFIIGIHHTITPTRWLIDLDLFGTD